MTRLVINKCFGGFGLSKKAMLLYAEIKGLNIYWLVLKQENFSTASLDERKASNKEYKKITLYDRDIPRDDETLLQVVEELGEEANNRYSKLEIIEIPDDVNWTIKECKGDECVSVGCWKKSIGLGKETNKYIGV